VLHVYVYVGQVPEIKTDDDDADDDVMNRVIQAETLGLELRKVCNRYVATPRECLWL